MIDGENKTLETALGYIEQGYRVVPVHRPNGEGKCSCGKTSCSAVGKHPSIYKWQEKASTDPTQVREWFRGSNLNIGIATGIGSGLVVLDIDGRHDGFDSLSRMEERYGALPLTLTVKTPGGGEHRYFSCTEELKNRVELAGYRGIDIRAENGFVVAPPSLHKSGGYYEFKDGTEPVARIPDWLSRLIKGEEKPPKQMKSQAGVTVIEEGRRNETLFRFGCKLRQEGASAEVIGAALWVKNTNECRPPLSDEEFLKIVENCCRYEAGGRDHQLTSASAWGYEIRHGQTVLVNESKEGKESVKLIADFWAKIAAERIRDNGSSSDITLLIQGGHQNGSRFPAISLPMDEFLYERWAARHWGTLANIGAGHGQQDHFRSAVQDLSRDRKVELTYTHTGWRRIDDRYLFLTGNGAIDAEGIRTDILVDLSDGSLTDVTLPAPPTGEELHEAIRTSLKILCLVPPRIAYPLYCGFCRAVLNELDGANFSLFLEGGTGLGKSAVAGVIQAFFGPKFSGSNLPLNFTSTANYNEAKAFYGKDLLLVVDDYVPGVTPDAWVERLLRGQGNRAGRGRMQADSTLRPTFYSRAVLLLTGEAPPRGGSALARALVLSLKAGDVDFDVLTDLQSAAASGVLSQVTSAFVRWVAPQMDSLKKEFSDIHTDLRRLATQSQMHKRTPDIMAQLGAALKIFLRFAEQSSAITSEESQKMWLDGWSALGEVAYQQVAFQASENPAFRFVDLISAAFVMGKAHLSDVKMDVKPADAQLLGWESPSEYGESWRPGGSKIGWYDVEAQQIWLMPDAAFAAAQEIARLQGSQLPVTKEVAWKRLAQEELIIPQKDKNLNRRTIPGGQRQMVLVFPAGVFLDKAMAPVTPATPVSVGAGVGGGLADIRDYTEKQKRRNELKALEERKPEGEVNS